MKKLTSLLLLCILFISVVQAFPIYVKPLDSNGKVQPSTSFTYQFNFTLNSDCTESVFSNTSTITTGKDGIGFIDLNISSISQVPNYLCEYRDGSLRKVHTLSDQLFRDIYARKGNFSQNVSADWFLGKLNYSSVQNVPSFLLSYTETDPIFLAENSSLWSEAKNKYNLTYHNKLDQTDQRYNETSLINSVNSSRAGIGQCPSGQVVQNTTNNGVQCVNLPSSGFTTNQNNELNTTGSPTFNVVNASRYTSDNTQLIIDNRNTQGASSTGKIQYKGIYQPTSGTPTSTIGNYFNATIDIDGVTSGGSAQTYTGNVFESKIDTHSSVSPFPSINYIGTSFPNRITGHQSGASFWTGQITGVNYDIDIDGAYASVAGINYFPMVVDVDYTANMSGSHQIAGLELTSTYNAPNSVNQVYAFRGTAEARGTTSVSGNLNPYYGTMGVDSGVTLSSNAIVYQAVLSDETAFNKTLASGKKVLGFYTSGSIFNMGSRETNAFYTDLQADANNYAFKAESAKSYFRDTKIDGTLAVGSNTPDGLTSGDINASTIYYDTLTAKSPEYVKSQSGLSLDKDGYPTFVECKEDAETGIIIGIEWKHEPSIWNKIKDVVGVDYNPEYVYNAIVDHPSCVNKKEKLDQKKQAIVDYENEKESCEADERMKFSNPSDYKGDGKDCDVNLVYYEELCMKDSKDNIFDREKFVCVNTNAESESEVFVFDVKDEIKQLRKEK